MAQASGTGRGQVRCQYHPDAHLAEDYRAGDMICTECGLVVGDRVIDVGRYVNLQSTCFPLPCISRTYVYSRIISANGEHSQMIKGSC